MSKSPNTGGVCAARNKSVQNNQNSGSRGGDHPGVLYFYSESVGLASNTLCALLAAASNFANVAGIENLPTLVSIGAGFLVAGGLLQLLASLVLYRSYNHFGATVFAFFSAFWSVLGLEQLCADFEQEETSSSCSIRWLHASLLTVNVLFAAVAPIVNGYYTLTLLTIAVASALEFAVRIVNTTSSDAEGARIDSGLYLATGVSEVGIILVTCYGIAASVLHGIYERQVLPGFDNALIETVLWKRKPLKLDYSDGIWANPKPLGSLCASMIAFAMGLWLYDPNPSSLSVETNIIPVNGLISWLAIFALVSWLVSLLHCLRSEQCLSITSSYRACLGAAVAFVLAFPIDFEDEQEHQETAENMTKAWMIIVFTIVQAILLIISMFEQPIAIDFTTDLLLFCSLAAGSIRLSYETHGLGICSIVMFSITSIFALYSGIAELANAVAQKELLPIGNRIMILRRRSKSGIDQHGNSGESTAKEYPECSSSEASEVDEAFPLADDCATNYDDHNIKYPGDEKLSGHSDFQTPLFLMLTGIALYALVLGSGMISSSSAIVFEACMIVLITQIAVIIICVARGQTSFGFCSLTFALEALLLVTGSDTSTDSISAATFLTGILTLQLVWLVSSFQLFGLLSAVVALHCTGTLFQIIFLTIEGIGSLQAISSFLFLLTGATSLFALFTLVCCNHVDFFRRLIQGSDDNSNELCEVGFANDREMFSKCVEILKNGGVCCIPTDTVYCLACAADRPDAIKRIYDIKSRPSEKPLSLWLGSIDDIKKVGPEGEGWGSKLFSFMDALWPGSVSLVVSRGNWLSRMGVGDAADLIGTKDSIALRVPNSTLTVSLLKETGPLAITSANPSGACDCTHHNKVDDLIASKIDFILADGPSPMTIASSVLDVRKIEDDELFFYRVGCVPEMYIWEKLHNLESNCVPRQMFATLPESNAESFTATMQMMCDLMNCDSWNFFLLSKAFQDEERDGMSWDEGSRLHPRVINAFLSGVSYYDNAAYNTAESSELVVPMLYHGKVCGVLRLLNKRVKRQDLRSVQSVNDTVLPFTKDDLHAARTACELAANMVDIEDDIVPMDLNSCRISVFEKSSWVRRRRKLRERSASHDTHLSFCA